MKKSTPNRVKLKTARQWRSMCRIASKAGDNHNTDNYWSEAMAYFNAAIYLAGFFLMVRHIIEVQKDYLRKSKRVTIIFCSALWPAVAICIAVWELFLWLTGEAE